MKNIEEMRKILEDVFRYGGAEEQARACLEIGFDVGVSASVGQFHTIEKTGRVTLWEPPKNPFRRESTVEVKLDVQEPR